MKLGIRRSNDIGAEGTINEYQVPIKGFLLRGHHLKGIYIEDGLLPVDEDLPRDVNEDIIRGSVKKILLVREVIKGSLRLIEAYINDDGRRWLVHRAPVTSREGK
ncbi:hypothetical protein A3L11_05780 [Thermococcus siculi]|uniref:Uncharacterized protein n=1 Tax=Thermococcus siculi TaxID=72803 RepID=A0A2Z2MK40_9EURY|nr:hypothetical protein [Thermococcus siculi]ASJ08759.1 hypothetical protein A3L11_05780 [Thermococcus siculi]